MLDDIAEGVNRKQSERIRAAVTDYLASSQLKKQ
jgi:predicted transcriptional regulator